MDRAGWSSWLQRYRPFIVLVVVVALVAWLPRIVDHDDDSQVGAVAGVGSAGPGAQTATGEPAAGGSGDAAAPGDAEVAGSGATAAGGGPAGGPARTGAAAGGPSVARPGSLPGVGTAAALGNPKCDRATGRIRFPSLFAPPCVAPWPAGADNGGSTAQGVTKDSIRIVVYTDPNPTPVPGQPPPNPARTRRQVTESIQLFASHYELWGRKLDIRFVNFSASRPQQGPDEATQRADAIQIANEHKPFIATSYLQLAGATPRVWGSELAARGVIVWEPTLAYADSQSRPGFRWGYNPDDRHSALMVGEYVGKRLWGRQAKWAGDALFKTQTRKFGLLYESNWDRRTFERTLARNANGAKVTDAVSYDGSADPTALQQQANTHIARLKSKGVNNVILAGTTLYNVFVTQAATSQNFFPEWSMTGWNLQDVAILSRLLDQQQWRNAFGIGLVPPLEQPVTISERSQLFLWHYGRQPEDDAVHGIMYLLGKDLIAGLHLAGPNLTPATYRAALFGMPPSGGRWCGCVTHGGVSFGRHLAQYPGDKYTDIDDYAEKWWDVNALGEDETGTTGRGMYRVVAGGKRYLPGDFPRTEPDVFNPANAVIGYQSQPKNDRWPTYPRPRR